jgi:hypothetical protein
MTSAPSKSDIRPGEVTLDRDLVPQGDMTLKAIGRIRSPWSKGNCPKNLREARAQRGGFSIEIDAPFRPGLAGLTAGGAIVVLYWMDAARRDLIVQSPAHRDGPVGTFALRSRLVNAIGCTTEAGQVVSGMCSNCFQGQNSPQWTAHFGCWNSDKF